MTTPEASDLFKYPTINERRPFPASGTGAAYGYKSKRLCFVGFHHAGIECGNEVGVACNDATCYIGVDERALCH